MLLAYCFLSLLCSALVLAGAILGVRPIITAIVLAIVIVLAIGPEIALVIA